MSNWQRALITGASSGIGADMARVLARQGVRVAVTARRRDVLDALAQELGPQTVVVEGDLTDPWRAKAVVDEAHERLGGLDLVIANAGMGLNRRATKLEVHHILDVLRLNVLGACATLTAAIPYFVAQGHGHLAGVTSLAGLRGLPTSAAYCASKAALSSFLESLRVDLAGSNVTVSDVRPGFVATPMTAKNKFPMPFMVSSPDAAERVVRALAKKRRVYAFPFPTAVLMRALSLVPAFLYERVAARAPV